jgi:hypothetical protein
MMPREGCRCQCGRSCCYNESPAWEVGEKHQYTIHCIPYIPYIHTTHYTLHTTHYILYLVGGGGGGSVSALYLQ